MFLAVQGGKRRRRRSADDKNSFVADIFEGKKLKYYFKASRQVELSLVPHQPGPNLSWVNYSMPNNLFLGLPQKALVCRGPSALQFIIITERVRPHWKHLTRVGLEKIPKKAALAI